MILLYILLGVFAVMNVVTLCLYAADKKKAKKGNRRIPEKVLLLCSFFGGGIGGYIAMLVFRHKTRREHWYFTFVNLLGIALQIAALVLALVFKPF